MKTIHLSACPAAAPAPPAKNQQLPIPLKPLFLSSVATAIALFSAACYDKKNSEAGSPSTVSNAPRMEEPPSHVHTSSCKDCSSHILPQEVVAASAESAVAPAGHANPPAPIKPVSHEKDADYQVGDRVALPLGGGEDFVVKILTTPKTHKPSWGFRGVLEGARDGEFLFGRLEDGRIRGQIHIPSEDIGYVFFLNTDGTVFKDERKLGEMPTICAPTPIKE